MNTHQQDLIFKNYIGGKTAVRISVSLGISENHVRVVFFELAKVLGDRLPKGALWSYNISNIAAMRKEKVFWLTSLELYRDDQNDAQCSLHDSVAVLGLSTRAKTCLLSEGIETVGALVRDDLRDLVSAANLGPKTCSELETALRARGLSLSVSVLHLPHWTVQGLKDRGFATIASLTKLTEQAVMSKHVDQKDLHALKRSLAFFGVSFAPPPAETIVI